MKVIKLFFFILLIQCSLNSVGQTKSEFKPNAVFVNNNSDTFLISTRPVTNREYIIYLLWLHNTYADYPEVVLDAIPGLKQNIVEANILEFFNNEGVLLYSTILKYCPPYVKNYIFNSKYLDFPVIGVSWLQANKYCKWLSDRLNEDHLIKKGYFLPDTFQINENCFITESYLADQYYGKRTVEKENELIKWTDQKLIPAFRLPTSKEIESLTKQKIIETSFKPYKFENSNFLKQWNDWYIHSDDKILELKYSDLEKSFKINSDSLNWDIEKYSYSELTFDNNLLDSNYSIADIYSKHYQNLININVLRNLEKDSIGQMPYIIIDENSKLEPIGVYRFKRSEAMPADCSKLYFFRFSGSIKPNQYKH